MCELRFRFTVLINHAARGNSANNQCRNFYQNLPIGRTATTRFLATAATILPYEYTALAGINDTPELAEELASYILKTASSKINIIPYNPVPGKPFDRSDKERIGTLQNHSPQPRP